MSVALQMPSGYRSREWFAQRIKTLNKKNCTTAAQLQATFNELAQISVEMAREVTAVALMQAFTELVNGTPVATRRARSGWQIVTMKSETEFAPGMSPGEIASALAKAVPTAQDLTSADVIWVINNVEYILALNAGWSKQLPGGFIDNFILSLRTRLEEAAQKVSKAR